MLGVQRRAWIAACMGAVGAGLGSAASASWFGKSKPEFLPLPVLQPGKPLRVVYAHNPRFARPSAQLLADVLNRTQTLCQEHFRLTIRFDAPVEQEIRTLFQGISKAKWKGLKADIYDFRDGPPDRKRLVADMASQLSHNSSPVGEKIAFAKAHLLSPIEPKNTSTLAEALIDTQLARFTSWQQLQAADGQALLNEQLYNEYFAWVFGPRTHAWPFEVVITNQLIASVEYTDNSLHSALRGGVSNGLTTQSPSSRYGTVSVCSLFPMTSADPLTRQLRGDAPDTQANPTEAIAALLTHELGHQLLHLGHPFNSKACVMNPAELLQFDRWTQGLDALKCPLGHMSENKPGAYRFHKIKN